MPRMTIEVGEMVNQLLTEQAKVKGITKSEVIRRAVSNYALLSDEAAKGRKVAIADRKTDQILKELIVF